METRELGCATFLNMQPLGTVLRAGPVSDPGCQLLAGCPQADPSPFGGIHSLDCKKRGVNRLFLVLDVSAGGVGIGTEFTDFLEQLSVWILESESWV